MILKERSLTRLSYLYSSIYCSPELYGRFIASVKANGGDPEFLFVLECLERHIKETGVNLKKTAQLMMAVPQSVEYEAGLLLQNYLNIYDKPSLSTTKNNRS